MQVTPSQQCCKKTKKTKNKLPVFKGYRTEYFPMKEINYFSFFLAYFITTRYVMFHSQNPLNQNCHIFSVILGCWLCLRSHFMLCPLRRHQWRKKKGEKKKRLLLLRRLASLTALLRQPKNRIAAISQLKPESLCTCGKTAGSSSHWSVHNSYWGLHPLNQHIFSSWAANLRAAVVDFSEVTFTWWINLFVMRCFPSSHGAADAPSWPLLWGGYADLEIPQCWLV